ncbi:MAG: hypothetical protein ACLFO2_00675 [Candidatus Woesearchaeota archaeon]
MVKRSISKQRYLTAAIITVLVFALGVLLGMVMDYERVQYLENQYEKHELDYRSLQLQFSFLDMATQEDSCAAFEAAMEDAVTELSDSLQEVEQYQGFSQTQQGNFDSIKRRYTLDNIRYWILVKEAQERCPMDRLSILYFFSTDDCPRCPDQGVILTYFKKKYGDSLLVFPIDVDLADDEPIVDMLGSHFNISRYPSIVMGDETFNGVKSQQELAPLICEGLNRGDC